VTAQRIDALLKDAAGRLRAGGIEQPMREARLMLAHAAGLAPTTVMAWPERLVAPEATDRLHTLLVRRLAHEPLSRILGRREFWSLDFQVTPATLDPRPDSETLIEALLDHVPDKNAPLGLVDFGTGTGCLLLALLSALPQAEGIGVDRSEAAARVAAGNAEALGLAARARFLVGDWDAAMRGGLDLIVSNPPYIPTGDLAGLMPEVRLHDPHAALDGGPDGLDPYRVLAPAARRLLKPGGLVGFEFGLGQAGAIAAILLQHGLAILETRRDLQGLERAIIAVQT
jgi:release factor glutamine methyltransferase